MSKEPRKAGLSRRLQRAIADALEKDAATRRAAHKDIVARARDAARADAKHNLAETLKSSARHKDSTQEVEGRNPPGTRSNSAEPRRQAG